MTGGRRTIGRDPGDLVLRAVLDGAPCDSQVELAEMTSTAWASATFTGARHAIRLDAVDDDALAAWLADLPDAQFRLGGHLLVDLAIATVDRQDGRAVVAIEALTVEDA